jgi:hypothetical protein
MTLSFRRRTKSKRTVLYIETPHLQKPSNFDKKYLKKKECEGIGRGIEIEE